MLNHLKKIEISNKKIRDNYQQHFSPEEKKIYKNLIKEFSDLSRAEHGNDQYMRAFYSASLNLLKTDPTIFSVLYRVLKKRDINHKHLANLFFRTIQFEKLFPTKDKDYPKKFINPKLWEKEIKLIIETKKNDIENVLIEKDTTTTIYQRYAGIKIILSSLLNEKSLNVADFGCGGNYGLPGIVSGMKFKKIIDNSDDSQLTKLLREKINIKHGLAVDKENPYLPASKKWRYTCSFYPNELGMLKHVIKMEQKLKKVKKIKFLQSDILELPKKKLFYKKHYYDTICISTVCYQMPEDQKKIITIARHMLKHDGILILQDFAENDKKDSDKLNFNISWFSKPFSYRTFVASEKTSWKIKEILKWNNGRCLEVQPGKDFKLLKAYLDK